MTLAALEQGAPLLLFGRIEDEVQRSLEPIGDFILMRFERKIGRDDSDDWSYDIAGHCSVRLDCSNELDGRGIEEDLLTRFAQCRRDCIFAVLGRKMRLRLALIVTYAKWPDINPGKHLESTTRASLSPISWL